MSDQKSTPGRKPDICCPECGDQTYTPDDFCNGCGYQECDYYKHATQAARIEELEEELEDLKSLFNEQGKLMGVRTRENDGRWKTIQALTAQVKPLREALDRLLTTWDDEQYHTPEQRAHFEFAQFTLAETKP